MSVQTRRIGATQAHLGTIPLTASTDWLNELSFRLTRDALVAGGVSEPFNEAAFNVAEETLWTMYIRLGRSEKWSPEVESVIVTSNYLAVMNAAS